MSRGVALPQVGFSREIEREIPFYSARKIPVNPISRVQLVRSVKNGHDDRDSLRATRDVGDEK